MVPGFPVMPEWSTSLPDHSAPLPEWSDPLLERSAPLLEWSAPLLERSALLLLTEEASTDFFSFIRTAHSSSVSSSLPLSVVAVACSMRSTTKLLVKPLASLVPRLSQS